MQNKKIQKYTQHTVTYTKHLVAKPLSEKLHSVFNDVVTIMNSIKERALNARLLSLLCEDMGADHKHLLCYSGLRWLSSGKVLCRVYELMSEVTAFLESAEHELVGAIKKHSWEVYLAYLADI